MHATPEAGILLSHPQLQSTDMKYNILNKPARVNPQIQLPKRTKHQDNQKKVSAGRFTEGYED